MKKLFENPVVRLMLVVADIAFSVVGVPILGLWSLNAVFGLGIPYGLKQLVGALLIKMFVKAYLSPKPAQPLQLVTLDPRMFGGVE